MRLNRHFLYQTQNDHTEGINPDFILLNHLYTNNFSKTGKYVAAEHDCGVSCIHYAAYCFQLWTLFFCVSCHGESI